MSNNYFYDEIEVTNDAFQSKETRKFPTTMTHMIIVHDGDTDSNTTIEWSFCGKPHPLHGRLKPRCDGPIAFDGLNVSKIWLKKTGTESPTKVRIWAWRRGGG